MTTSWRKPSVSAGFDAYDDYVEHRLAYLPLTRDLENLYGGDAVVLDYGCGSGKVSRRLLDTRAAGRVVGVDISANMVRLAQSQTPQDAARFHTIDSGHVPYPDHTFDAVVCCFVFINVSAREDLRRIADELARVLKPSGSLFIVDSNPAATGIQFPTFRSGEPGRDYQDGDERKVSLQVPGVGVLELVDRHWSISTYESVLASAGFTIREITTRGADTVKDVGAQEPVDQPPFIQIRAQVNGADAVE
ncbi:class I SAM-dependent methyltransferase [Brevibacterium otitidis]|uniref:Class I SAM-dependent methyltransferase n=1 Tax=Brevibacterium otitidis TaxID=53364 RepID=A0ABV5WZ06_9MICO|nr:methyltransferase domain-containing protein [Brevibacterium otitidis]BFF08593.1 methyltransferase domain-containing protein [Brevibacterium otitidis]